MPININRYFSVIIATFLFIPAYCDEYATRLIENKLSYPIIIEATLKDAKKSISDNYDTSFVEFFDGNLKSLGCIGDYTDKPSTYTIIPSLTIPAKTTYSMKFHTRNLAFRHVWKFTFQQPNHLYYLYANIDHGVTTRQEDIVWTDISGKPLSNSSSMKIDTGNFTFGSF